MKIRIDPFAAPIVKGNFVIRSESKVENSRTQRSGTDIPSAKSLMIVDVRILSNSELILSYTLLNTQSPLPPQSLIFMGSKKYPYKGIIDRFANRGFANGTGAWTAVDSTVYTLSTAGDQGFLQLLPIYIDHLISPILTESAFVTEVH